MPAGRVASVQGSGDGPECVGRESAPSGRQRVESMCALLRKPLEKTGGHLLAAGAPQRCVGETTYSSSPKCLGVRTPGY